ncbi:MAG: hypothetical protein ACE5FA_13835, partial [Dehalococcoidia bacterium]
LEARGRQLVDVEFAQDEERLRRFQREAKVLAALNIEDAPGRPYDVSLNGDRFLMIRESDQGASSVALVFVLNWFQELQRLAPADD